MAITKRGDKELYDKYFSLRDGNAIYYDDLDDDPNVTVDIEWIVQNGRQDSYGHVLGDFGEGAFNVPRIIIYRPET